METIDLDQNATSPVAPEVLDAMRPHWLAGANPDSRHSRGRAARRTLDGARETIAGVLGADPSEVVFTSGGTESNNLALFGLARATRQDELRHLVTSPIEHPAVSEPVGRLEAEGWQVSHLPIDGDGLARADALIELMRSETRLVTLMRANNEVGTLQPVARLAELAAERGVPVHTDAVQAVGRLPVDFHGLGVTTLAASAHKMHGPAGIGVLLVRRGTSLDPLLLGGGQQGGRRPGTVPVALCVGLARAMEIWGRDQETRRTRWERLRSRLADGLREALGNAVVVHGPSDPDDRLPQTLHVGFPGADGNALLMKLDLAGVCASLGAACASGATRPSPTLMAMGVPEDQLRASIRFSLGAMTTEEEIEETLRRTVAAVRSVT